MSRDVEQGLRVRLPHIVERAYSTSVVSSPADRDALREEVGRHIDFLLAAGELGRPSLFIEYAGWVSNVSRARRRPSDELDAVFREIREAILELGAPSASALISIVDAGLARMREDTSAAASPAAAPDDGPTARLSRLYLELLLAARRRDALDLVMNALDEGLPLEDLYLRVLQPAMREVGRLWERNEISVAQEHYISAATQLIVSQLYPRLLDGPRNGKKLLAACVAPNLHEMGLRFLCDIFELRGWDTHFYGANTPTPDFVESVQKREPDVVAIGATLTCQLPAVSELIRQIRSRTGEKRPRILVGGAAFWGHEELWKEIGADGFARDALAAIELSDALTGAS